MNRLKSSQPNDPVAVKCKCSPEGQSAPSLKSRVARSLDEDLPQPKNKVALQPCVLNTWAALTRPAAWGSKVGHLPQKTLHLISSLQGSKEAETQRMEFCVCTSHIF